MSERAPSDDKHDKLVKAYLEYFKSYDAWKERPSVRRYFTHQQKIKQLIYIARELNTEVRDEFYADRERPGVKLKRKNDDAQQK